MISKLLGLQSDRKNKTRAKKQRQKILQSCLLYVCLWLLFVRFYRMTNALTCMRVRHLSCSFACYKATSRPDLKGHCRAIIKQSERESESCAGKKKANKMKNNSEVLKRQGQKSFPPAACSSDMTNKSPSRHQSPGIKRETHTIDPDAFVPEEKHGVGT